MPKKSYVGQLIAANPLNPKDNLNHSVILIVTHTPDLALGLQLNRPLLDLNLAEVSDQVGIFVDSQEPVYYGGKMSPNKIHVVHSNDWSGLTTVQITDQLSVTNDISVLAALSQGQGPEFYKACAGFWGWDRGQLDAQITAKSTSNVKHRWETAPATLENVFAIGAELDHWHRVIEAAAREQVSNWF
jgi:putative transcriptional regulator